MILMLCLNHEKEGLPIIANLLFYDSVPLSPAKSLDHVVRQTNTIWRQIYLIPMIPTSLGEFLSIQMDGGGAVQAGKKSQK